MIPKTHKKDCKEGNKINAQLNVSSYLKNKCSKCRTYKSLSDIRCLECGESLNLSLDSSSFISFFEKYISTWKNQQLELNNSNMIDDLFSDSPELNKFIINSTIFCIFNYLLNNIFPVIESQLNEIINFHPDLQDSIENVSKLLSKKAEKINNLLVNMERIENPFKILLEKYSEAYQKLLNLNQKLKKKKRKDKILTFLGRTTDEKVSEILLVSKKKLRSLLKDFYIQYKTITNSDQLISNYTRVKLNIDEMHESQIPAELLHIQTEYKSLIYVLDQLVYFNIPVLKNQKKALKLKNLVMQNKGDKQKCKI